MISPKPKRTYAKAIADFTFKRTVSRADTVSMMAGVLVPALLTVARVTVADTTIFVAWCVIGIVACVATARLIAAPYFLWKAQSARIAEIEAEVADLKNSPTRKMAERLADRHADDRVEMSQRISDIRSRARSEPWSTNVGYNLFLEARPVAERLSVDLNFKSLWLYFVEVTTEYVMKKPVADATKTDGFGNEELARILAHEHGPGQQMVYASEKLHRFLMTGER